VPSVTVDEDLCVGTGDCARIAPLAFVVDEDRNVSVPQPAAAPTDLRLLVQAARQCPTNAIRVVDDDGTVAYESA
jgi:ferredoxin